MDRHEELPGRGACVHVAVGLLDVPERVDLAHGDQR
jgi:hypothetical protein